MLFMATHTHTPDLCPSDNPAAVHQLADENHIKESGVKVISSLVAPPEHTFYFILEAGDYSQVVRYLRPVMKIGTHRIIPVQTLTESMGIFPTR